MYRLVLAACCFEKKMSNSMSLEKIFIILAIILGLGSIIDLLYSLATFNFALAEILRCLFNIAIAVGLYLYASKKHKANLELSEVRVNKAE